MPATLSNLAFTLETYIDRPAAEVFAYVTDPHRLPTWQTNTVSAVQEGDGPLGLGTRLREVHRAPGGKELVSVVEVSEFEPGRVFALRVVEGTPVHLRIVLAPFGDMTHVSFRVHGPVGAIKARLLGPILRRQFTAQLATLKSVLDELEPVAERVG